MATKAQRAVTAGINQVPALGESVTKLVAALKDELSGDPLQEWEPMAEQAFATLNDLFIVVDDAPDDIPRDTFRGGFDRSVKLEFRRARVIGDAGRLAIRELDDA